MISYDQYLTQLKTHPLVPISTSFMADLETPISLFLKLKADYLLESVEKGASLGRYSIIAKGQRICITLTGGTATIVHAQPHHTQVQTQPTFTFNDSNPLNYLKKWMEKFSVSEDPTHPSDLPFYQGGWLGFLGQETMAYFEPTVPIYPMNSPEDDLKIPDGILVFPELICVFDNVLRKLWLIVIEDLDQLQSSLETPPKTLQQMDAKLSKTLPKRYQEKLDQLNGYQRIIEQPLHYPKPTLKNPPEIQATSYWSKEAYQKLVETAKDYIYKGEIIQVVLSNRYSIKTDIDAFEVYRTLKTLNPSPYLYYLNFGDFKLIGSSPEVMVKLEGEDIMVKPIAGTRKRGHSVEEDRALMEDLLQDEKELAEHIMLVDLGRNDLGRVAKYGSVKVENYMSVEKYSQVQHIVSTVKAKKLPKVDAMDLIKATFPAGTLSGAPKIRAMEIIHELEKLRRGPYGGMVLFLSLNGNLNSCITIRTIIQKKDQLYIQAGAGIVQDSIAELENEECQNKAIALIKAIEATQQRLSKN